MNLGSRLKTPVLPIWVTCINENWGVLFNPNRDLMKSYSAENRSSKYVSLTLNTVLFFSDSSFSTSAIQKPRRRKTLFSQLILGETRLVIKWMTWTTLMRWWRILLRRLFRASKKQCQRNRIKPDLSPNFQMGRSHGWLARNPHVCLAI